jgi:3-oxoacyl-[acyl-carrier protein] reductase
MRILKCASFKNTGHEKPKLPIGGANGRIDAMKPAKEILLTGASGVIGQALARRLAGAGYRLHLTSRHPSSLAALQRELGRSIKAVYPLDLSRPVQAEAVTHAFFKRARRPYALLCNAGTLGTPGRYRETRWELWNKTFIENFLSHARMIQCFARQFARRRLRSGRIVTLSGAGLGASSSFWGITGYSTAKAALVHLSEALSGELAEQGMTINAIAPGAVLSGMTRQAIRAGSKRVGPQAQSATDCLKHGGVSPDLAARLVEFLLSPEARSISGRLLSARFDQDILRKQRTRLQRYPHQFRMRRIDHALFAPVKS